MSILPDLLPELTFKTARSSGAGGQNVNKVETKVEVRFDIAASALLQPSQIALLLQRLSPQLIQGTILQVTAQEKRSQLRNKELAIRKLYKILENNLAEVTPRKATKPSLAAIEKRLKQKQLHAQKKAARQRFDGA